MKRDARIGLAVVLVLGLAVTLLIGRALVKRGEVADSDNETSGGPAPYSAEAAHVDGAPAANISTPSAAPTLEGAEPAARQPEANPAVKQFVDDQTRRLGVENSPANPSPVPPPAANRAPAVEGPVVGPTRPIGGPISEAPAPKNDHSLLLDHEGPTPATDTAPPSDGYGYTVAAGDNMWKISSKVYGDGKYTQKIVDANPNLNAAKMKTGAIIKIPIIQNKTVLMKLPSFAEASAKPAGGSAIAAKDADKKEAKKSAEPVAASTTTKAPEAAVSTEPTTHKVEAGETLGVIAQKYYGSSGPKSVGKILAANKGLDAAKLKVGQEIQIPAKK